MSEQKNNQSNIINLQERISNSLNAIDNFIEKSDYEKSQLKLIFDDIYVEVENHLTFLETAIEK